MPIDDLLNEAYHYVITVRLPSDPVERCFSQYRRMNDGMFLINLREVQSSERILLCRPLNKENFIFGGEDLTSKNQECVTVIEDIYGIRRHEIVDNVLDENSIEVTTDYVAKKLIKRSKCESCMILLKAGDFDDIAKMHN